MSFIDDMLAQGDQARTPAEGPAPREEPNFIDLMLDQAPPPSAVATAQPESPPPGAWGPLAQTAQGLTLGGFAPVLAYAGHKVGGLPYKEARERVQAAQDAYAKESPLGSLGIELGSSLPTTIGAMALGQEYAIAPFAARVGSLLPKASALSEMGSGLGPVLMRGAAKVESGVGRLLGYGAQGAGAGALQSGLTGQTPGEGALQGAALGPVAGVLGSALARPLQAAIDPYTAQVGQAFSALGQKILPSQLKGGPLAAKAFGSAPSASQINDLTRGVSRTFGEDVDALTPEVFHAPGGAYDRAGAMLENAARSATIPGNDPKLLGGLNQVLSRASREFGPDSAEYAKLQRMFDGVREASRGGNISGASYLDLTQTGSAIKNAMARTSPTRQYAIELKDALDDALERANPAQAQAIAQGRHAWHNALIAEDSVDAAGKIVPNDLYKNVTSARHYGSTFKASSKADEAGGLSDIGTLAQGSKMFLTGKSGGVSKFVHQHPMATAGAAVLGEQALEPLAATAGHLFGEHPIAGALSGGILGAYGAGGLAMRNPAYANMLMRGYDPFSSLPNAALPLSSYLYGKQAGAQ